MDSEGRASIYKTNECLEDLIRGRGIRRRTEAAQRRSQRAGGAQAVAEAKK